MILGLDCSHSKQGKTRELLTRATPDTILELTAENTAEANEVIKQADGLLIATPVHWFNVPWVLKKLIDAMDTEPGVWPFEDTPLGVLTVCNEDGGEMAGLLIIGPLLHMGFFVPPFSLIFHNSGMQGGEDNWQNEEVLTIVARLREWVQYDEGEFRSSARRGKVIGDDV